MTGYTYRSYFCVSQIQYSYDVQDFLINRSLDNQPFSLDDPCLEVHTVHSNELRLLFLGQGILHIQTIFVAHLT